MSTTGSFMAGLCALSAAAHAQNLRVLVFTKTAGFRHESIPAAVAAVQALGAEHCFDVEATEDASATPSLEGWEYPK
jgi:hypothetical protein